MLVFVGETFSGILVSVGRYVFMFFGVSKLDIDEVNWVISSEKYFSNC